MTWATGLRQVLLNETASPTRPPRADAPDGSFLHLPATGTRTPQIGEAQPALRMAAVSSGSRLSVVPPLFLVPMRALTPPTPILLSEASSVPGPAGTFPDSRPHWDHAPPNMPDYLSGGGGWEQWERFCSGGPPFLEGGDILLSHVLSAALLAEGINWLGPHGLDYNVPQRSPP